MATIREELLKANGKSIVEVLDKEDKFVKAGLAFLEIVYSATAIEEITKRDAFLKLVMTEAGATIRKIVAQNAQINEEQFHEIFAKKAFQKKITTRYRRLTNLVEKTDSLHVWYLTTLALLAGLDVQTEQAETVHSQIMAACLRTINDLLQ